MSTDLTPEEALEELEAKFVRLHLLLFGTWKDRDEAHITINELVDGVRDGGKYRRALLRGWALDATTIEREEE